MRTAIIPAQIITVEDKIAGNLTLSQIIILMIPLIVAMLIYSAFPPVMKFSAPKLFISIGIALFSMLLALRIKGKIIMQWIIILLRYNLRPAFYIYNKNDSSMRNSDSADTNKKSHLYYKKEKDKSEQKIRQSKIIDLIKIEKLLIDPAISLRFKSNKKGGLTIAIDQIK